MGKLIFILFLLTPPVFSQEEHQTGTLTGSVKDSTDGQPVVGANIMLDGTVLGTTTSREGKFSIRDIPAGNYALSASIVGYKRRIINVLVKSGEETTCALDLEEMPVEAQPVIVTANKREQSFLEAPVSVSVVSEQQLSDRNSITIDDALRYVGGVNITKSQVNVRGSTGYSFGVGTRVLLLLDGLPFLSGDTQEIIWESLPAAEADRIEVVKGAGSALYGSNALGGVINVITKTSTQEPETRVRLYGGAYQLPKYESWRWTQDARTMAGAIASHRQRIGDIGVELGLSRTLDDGYRKNDYWKRWNAWSRLSYDISPFRSAAISFRLLDQRRGNFLYWKDLDHALEPQDEQLREHVESLRWNLGASYKQFVSGVFYYTLKFSWFRSRWEDNIPNEFDPAGSASRSDYLVGELQANYQASDRHVFTGGLSTSYNNVHAGSIFGDHRADGGALYLQDEAALTQDVRVTIGGRIDFQRLMGVEDVSQFNPKFGAVYNPGGATIVRISAGRGFRAPSVAEVYTTTEAGGITIVPNAALKPERSWSFEAGVSQVFRENITSELALFRNEFWDMIEPTFGADGKVQFQNILRSRITGAEMTLNVDFMRRILSTVVSYTYLYPEDVTRGDILKYRPRNMLYASGRFLFDPFSLAADFRFLSKTERIDEEFISLGIVPGGSERVNVYVTDVRLGADWKFAGLPMISIFHVNNLFQYYYVDLIGNLAPTRNYVLTLETKF